MINRRKRLTKKERGSLVNYEIDAIMKGENIGEDIKVGKILNRQSKLSKF